MGNKVIEVGAGYINLSPDAFRLWAGHFVEYESALPRQEFSPVPFFLLSRAIELQLKSHHLETKTQAQVKKRFGHTLSECYRALDKSEQILTATEEATLDKASAIYSKKDFEYFYPMDALTAFKRYPRLSDLRALAKKLVNRKPFVGTGRVAHGRPHKLMI